MLFGTVACLGDSLTFGARASMGYPELLPSLMTGDGLHTEWATRNFGVSGETTRQVLDRTPQAVGWLAAQGGARRLVVLAGTNDSKGTGLALDQWESLYRQILHWPRRHGIPTVLCTFPPVEPVSREMPVFTDASRGWLGAASERVRRIAAELDGHGCTVSVCELEDMDPTMLCDGVHLHQHGYVWMAQRIARALGYGVAAPAAAPAGDAKQHVRRPRSVAKPKKAPRLTTVREF